MITRTSKGRGFKGAAAYYLHDKGASTSNRVRFTQTLNLANDDPRLAVNEMCWTAMHQQQLKDQAGTKNTGRKLEKPVYTFSLSWHPTETPTDAHMQEAVVSALKRLKMENHQVIMVAHNDTDHDHIHVLVNRVDPATGIAHGLNTDHLVLSRWSQQYQRERGQTWCPARIRNNELRRQAAIEKAQGKRRSAFVKDVEGQKRDRPSEFVRRAKAIEDRRKDRAPGQQKPLRDAFRSRARDAAQDARRASQLAAEAAQKAREAREKQQRDAATELAARRDALKKRRELYRARAIDPPSDPAREARAFRDQQAQDRRKAAFEEWQIARLNALQDRHIEQREAQAKIWDRRRLEAEQVIEQEYGASRRQQEARLAELNRRSQKPLSRFADRMRGGDDERRAIEMNIANIDQRTQDVRGTVERQQADATDRLRQQQEQDKRDLSALFDRQEKAGYRIPDDPAQDRRSQSGPSRGPGGPER